MTAPKPPRFDIAVVLDVVGHRIGYHLPDKATGLRFSDADAAELINVNADSFGRWRRRGWIGVDTAEHLAHRLGYHPTCLWPSYHVDVAAHDAHVLGRRDRELAAQRRRMAAARVARKAARQLTLELTG